MNARLLTIALLSCSMLATKFLLVPQYLTASQAAQESAQTQQQLARVQSAIEFTNSFKPSPQSEFSTDEMTMQTLSRWRHVLKDYGVSLSDVSAGTHVGGKTTIEMNALQTPQPQTGLTQQVITLKGSYETLEEFEKFVREQIVQAGASVSSIHMHGYSFEMQVQVFGKSSQGS